MEGIPNSHISGTGGIRNLFRTYTQMHSDMLSLHVSYVQCMIIYRMMVYVIQVKLLHLILMDVLQKLT